MVIYDGAGRRCGSGPRPGFRRWWLAQGLKSGDRVLELGSYQAAVLHEVVGPTGRAVTVGIDPEIVE
ncbi:hypothetical protein [Nonomuraea sp. NPDC049709]|uniref:hypothetical protein n=1 Tax=Nonomuraea sp. NPDC049709 TaxID=3154736 RepID=UPI003415BFFD